MPRRTGWFLLVEAVSGARMWHPVDNQRGACTAIERLAPAVPLTSVWSMEWRDA